eukprot:5139032-Amphidinium_carterae.3
MAAYLCRLGQAAMTSEIALLRRYVDDPHVTLAGPAASAMHTCGILLLIWSAFGARLSWKKRSFGRKVSWIGASFMTKLVEGLLGITCKVSDEKFAEMMHNIFVLRDASGMIPCSAIRTLAGQLGKRDVSLVEFLQQATLGGAGCTGCPTS